MLKNSFNKEPYHSPLVPAIFLKKNIGSGELENYISLNGSWKFEFVDKDHPAGGDSQNISVPGSWQMQGFGKPVYLNTKYAFCPDSKNFYPPHIPPDVNSTGIYNRGFSVPDGWLNRKIFIHFGGVESEFYLYINGKLAGYSTNSMAPAEFNITYFVQSGENNLTVHVNRYSEGSWLEDQDMWRLSGIFRDVYIFNTPEIHLMDFYATSEFDSEYKNATLKVNAKVINYSDKYAEPHYVQVQLFDENGIDVLPETSSYTGNKNMEWENPLTRVYGDFPKGIYANTVRTVYLRAFVNDPLKWTAETPNRYRLVLTLKNQEGFVVDTAWCYFGFREIKTDGGKITVNGTAIKLKGVNRHDFDPDTGRYVKYENMLNDVLLMKRFNINALRASHYPSDPIIYDLCDEYGIYVMDEANMETHAISYRDDVLPGNDPRWTDKAIDRISSVVLRDKNHCSVIMWSMGNEVGYGENIALMAAYCRTIDPTRLIHKRQMNSVADVDSETYPAISWLKMRGEKKPDKPFIANEYAHAMGNAMGSLSEYWEVFNSYDCMAGGFIWEWADHGIRCTHTDGKEYFAYGGDFGEEYHDKDFCLDGVVGPCRNITAKLWEVKKAHEFIMTELLDGGTVKITNNYFHTNLDEFYVKWVVMENDIAVEAGETSLPNVLPGCSFCMEIPHTVKIIADYEYYLNLSFNLAQDTAWAKRGHEVAFGQFKLNHAENPKTVINVEQNLSVQDTDTDLTIYNDSFSVSLSKTQGIITSLKYSGSEIIHSGNGFSLNVFRAPTNNDKCSPYILEENGWYKAGLNDLRSELKSLTVKENKSSGSTTAVLVEVNHTYYGKIDVGFEHTVGYSVFGNGYIYISSKVVPFGKLPVLPKIGLLAQINHAYENLIWYGRGPHESYADRKASAKVGIYESKVSMLGENYISPQETGNNEDVRWVALASNENSGGVLIAADTKVCFTASNYSPDDLDKATHTYELPNRKEIYLSIDWRQNGLGNRSCGPEVLEEYKLYPEPMVFGFCIKPITSHNPKDINETAKNDISPQKRLVQELVLTENAATTHDAETYIDPSDPDARKNAGLE